MKTSALTCALTVLFSLGMMSPRAVAGGQAPRMTFGGLTIEGQSWQGNFQEQEPWEWKGPVTVKASGLTMTCDASFKLWPTADFSDFERVEAAGNVRVEGRYVTSDKTAWEIRGRADSATYHRESQRGTLAGEVHFEARNSVSGAVLTAVGEKLTYDAESQRFSFERGEEPVRMEWQQPPDKAEEPAAASSEGG